MERLILTIRQLRILLSLSALSAATLMRNALLSCIGRRDTGAGEEPMFASQSAKHLLALIHMSNKSCQPSNFMLLSLLQGKLLFFQGLTRWLAVLQPRTRAC